MKKNKKNIIIYFTLIFIGIVFIFYFLIEKNISIIDNDLSIKKNYTAELKNTKLEIQSAQKVKKEDNVIFKIQDRNFSTQIKKGDTVFIAMNNLQKNKTNNFSFTYKEYNGLGIFVEEINEIKRGGKYWIYSVNGNEASVGVSKFKLNPGDIISWELK